MKIATQPCRLCAAKKKDEFRDTFEKFKKQNNIFLRSIGKLGEVWINYEMSSIIIQFNIDNVS